MLQRQERHRVTDMCAIQEPTIIIFFHYYYYLIITLKITTTVPPFEMTFSLVNFTVYVYIYSNQTVKKKQR